MGETALTQTKRSQGGGRSEGRSPFCNLFGIGDGIGDGVRAIPLILKATQRARAQRLASLGAGRVALCVT